MLRKLTPIVQGIVRRDAVVILSNSERRPSCQRNAYSAPTEINRSSIYEPDYLESLRPEFPQYERLLVQIKGYDFPLLENYQRHLHSMAEYLDIDVSDCYALPPQQTQVQRLRPNSTVIESEYNLTKYERNLQINDVSTMVYPIFVRIARAALPEGVQLDIVEYTDELEERRYVPDRDLLDLKAELDRMGGSKKK